MSAVLEKSEVKAPKPQTRAPKETAESVAELQKLSDTLAAFKKEHDKPLPDCSTDEGYEQAKERRNAARAVLKSAEDSHKVAKSFYLENGRKVDAIKNDVIAVAEPIRKANHEAMRAVDDAKKQIEADRLAKIREEEEAMQAKLDAITELKSALDLDAVIDAIETLDNLNLQDFGEHSDKAIELSEDALDYLVTRKAELQAQADKEAELAEQKRKLDEQAAEQKRKDDEREAAFKAKEDALAADQQKVKDDARELKEAEARRAMIADAEKKAAEKAEREKKEIAEKAEARRLADIETARLDEQRKAQEAAQKVIDDKAEAERIEAAQNAEAEKQAAMKPDVDKLQIYIDDLDHVVMPAMTTKQGSEMLTLIDSIREAATRDMAAVVHKNKNKAA